VTTHVRYHIVYKPIVLQINSVYNYKMLFPNYGRGLSGNFVDIFIAKIRKSRIKNYVLCCEESRLGQSLETDCQINMVLW